MVTSNSSTLEEPTSHVRKLSKGVGIELGQETNATTGASSDKTHWLLIWIIQNWRKQNLER